MITTNTLIEIESEEYGDLAERLIAAANVLAWTVMAMMTSRYTRHMLRIRGSLGRVTSGNQKIFQSRMNQNETRCHLPQIHRYSKCFQGTAGCFRVKVCTRPQAINMHETSEKSKNIY
jgi:hypothetical protein